MLDIAIYSLANEVRVNFDYMIGNEVVNQVDSIKYLSVIIDKKISYLVSAG